VNSLKGVLHSKNKENDELIKNLKQVRLNELQEELKLHGREMSRLKDITKFIVSVAREKGLED